MLILFFLQQNMNNLIANSFEAAACGRVLFMLIGLFSRCIYYSVSQSYTMKIKNKYQQYIFTC